MEPNEERLAKARLIVREKLGFVRHFIVYFLVIVVLVIINNTTWAGYQWWAWPALAWGIGVFAHFLGVFVFASGRLESRLIDRELERMDEE
jgi:hypothetical protein